VREPSAQALSWWRYENAAIAWGRDMGLTEPNGPLRGAKYAASRHSRPSRKKNHVFVQTFVWNHACCSACACLWLTSV